MAARADLAVEVALDIPEQQVAIDFFDDGVYEWHARVLMVAGEAGHWVVLTPDLELEYVQISQHRVVPIMRGSEFPARVRGQLYYFDPIPADALDRLRTEARALASAVGIVVVAGPGAAEGAPPRWIVSDPSHKRFGSEIETRTVMNPQRFVQRDAVALADLGTTGSSDWVAAECVPLDDDEQWRAEKQTGPGRDYRVQAIRKDAAGHRRATLGQVVASARRLQPKDWVFRGPSALEELSMAVDATGLDFATYFNHWKMTSGVNPSGGVCIELKHLLEVLRLAFAFDQLEPFNLASLELVSRRILQIMRAVRRNARHPTFEGLEGMVAFSLDESGGVITSKFDEFFATEQKNAALIMKQYRLAQEEKQAEYKRLEETHGGPSGSADDVSQSGGGRGRGRGGRKGRGDK